MVGVDWHGRVMHHVLVSPALLEATLILLEVDWKSQLDDGVPMAITCSSGITALHINSRT